jgi:hypothetical protein
MSGSEPVMPLADIQDLAPEALLETGRRLQAAVSEHKAAIRRHREQLHTKKSALVALEATCRSLGIRFTVQE